jgi:peptide/nickel transport system ATP-binding protein
VLSVESLSVVFVRYGRGLARTEIEPVSDLDLEAREGEVVAVVGASGSGKSLLAMAVLGLLPANAKTTGRILYRGEILTSQRAEALRGREIVLIPQSVSFLDPLERVGAQVRRAARLRGMSRKRAAEAQKELFERYGLGAEVEDLFPFQLSGGMARRVLLACATIGDVRLILADEPTPGLHASAVEEALGHLRELADRGKAVVLITHDVMAALRVADRVAVFFAGTTVEETPVSAFSGQGDRLRHPYSRALWQALPGQGLKASAPERAQDRTARGGCPFVEDCPVQKGECMTRKPPRRAVEGGFARCFRA